MATGGSQQNSGIAGYAVNHERVLRIMRQDRLICHKKRFTLVTTDSAHGIPTYPNLLKGREITRVNQVWASDITYVQLQHEHIYLAVILDLCSQKCIEWELSRSLKSDLAMSALAKALKNRTIDSLGELVHHSDQGIQYASKDYVDYIHHDWI
jgi:transposase InsO family protein